jgi:hypothetical protein
MPAKNRRAFWVRQLHTWHWVSAAISLIGMLLFAATGITLNNATRIEAKPQVTTAKADLPKEMLAALAAEPAMAKRPLPPVIAAWIAAQMPGDPGGRAAEWSAAEVYVALPRPGGDAWISIDRETGEVVYERTDRGWISYLNDLHKGRHTGLAWSWFLDLFAVACVVFCVTGLFLLQLHASNRPATWPTVGLGLAIPLLLAVLFIH